MTDMEPGEGLNLLMEMQNGVVIIGEAIENADGEYSELIKLLEELAEHIYILYGQLKERRLSKDGLSEFQGFCARIESRFQKDISVIYEVVFIPYKASMWDALESIYMCAKECGNCHTVVMPVPYFCLDDKKQPVEMKYEADLFPSFVDIVNYEEYDIFKICPDVIFIHNPYDDKNKVTRFFSRYYSSELKKCTERLVYIPYKVCRGAVKDLFCVTPGVSNAWKVFVQSEKVRQIYIKYQDREKIIVAGSPKIDKVLNQRNSEKIFPEGWETALNGRKTFLLNTHLNSVVISPDLFIKKMKYLITLFDGREDIALLWRPHPLSMETLRSIKPAVLPEYLDLTEKVRELKNGVFDDTPDVHRAIVLSDAYMGDWSSLVTLYGMTGKPILVTDAKSIKINLAHLTPKYVKKQSGREYLKSIYYEKICGLDYFINLIVEEKDFLYDLREKEFLSIAANADGTAGQYIWDYVRADLMQGGNI